MRNVYWVDDVGIAMTTCARCKLSIMRQKKKGREEEMISVARNSERGEVMKGWHHAPEALIAPGISHRQKSALVQCQTCLPSLVPRPCGICILLTSTQRSQVDMRMKI